MRPNLFRLAHPTRGQRLKRRLVGWLLQLLVLLLVRLDVQGLERIPDSGPVIFYFNHIHYSDPFILAALLQKRRFTVAMAKRELITSPIVGQLMNWYGVIFVERKATDMRALREGLEVLAAGHCLLIAPEGTRNQVDHSLQPAKRGIGFLARHSRALLQPVAIWGTPNLLKGVWKARRTRVVVRFGQPFSPETPAGARPKATDMAIADNAMHRLAILLPEEMRGVYRT
ncbi:MAG: 1-acyl-sn-glycerol-3-phosphate acyltransferase [Chloroflexi bacterium]|nr:1-acyl-sn-glycerol-3-phosphate acyltransferase [Chloroflexota bacterium]